MRFLVGALAGAVLLLTLISAFGGPAVLAQGESPTAVPTSAAPTQTAGPTASPQPSPAPSPTRSGVPCPLSPPPTPPAPGATLPPHPLCPAVLSGDPVSLLAWAFTPVFQALFMGMVAFYVLFGDIGLAIILLTLVIKTLLLPLSRRQIVSQRRMQMLQPELRAIQQKFKGNRAKISEETMRLYRDRGINPASGCLPAILQLLLLLPIYMVISQGLSATDISSMLQIFGQPVLEVACQGGELPCITTTISWLGGLEAHRPQVSLYLPNPIIADPNFGLSGLALIAAALQLVQSRMMTPNSDDPQIRAQQRIFLFLPLISLFYGWFLPAGLFIYWIVFTAYSIVQQYLIAGWGSMFPLFGWTPGFAKDHKPRFPVEMPAPQPRADGGDSRETTEPRRSPSDRAAGTIRPARQKGRTSRRGRRR